MAVVAAGIGLGLLGALSWKLVFKPLYRDMLMTIAATTGIGLIMVQGIIVTVGERDIIVPTIFPGLLHVGGVTVAVEKIALIIITLLIMLAIYLFLGTKTGKALEATTIDEDAAALQGINSERMFLLATVVGSALAGVAGALIVPTLTAQAGMGWTLTLIFLCIVMVAGHGSIKGAIIVGLLFGLVESFGYYYVGTLDSIILFAVVAVIIYIRPWGIWGVEFKRTA